MWGSGWGRGERRRRGESPGANEASIAVTGGQKDEVSATRAPAPGRPVSSRNFVGLKSC